MGSKKHSEDNETVSDNYKIACEIYHQNIFGTEVWFNKLVDIFGDSMEVDVIDESVDKLFDNRIILSEKSKHLDQYKGMVYYISPESISKVANCYNLHWKDIREKWLSKNGFVTESWH